MGVQLRGCGPLLLGPRGPAVVLSPVGLLGEASGAGWVSPGPGQRKRKADLLTIPGVYCRDLAVSF